ncbi:MAG: ATP-binding protein [Phototrophicales bacterium]|nr:ATP-binding protein [Phototrophicales bacterium]
MVHEERLQIVAIMENVEKACEFVAKFARDLGFSEEMIHRCWISVDEVCANVIEHGYKENGHHEVIDVICHTDANLLIITFMDDSTPFNPLIKDDPDPYALLEDREVGGWGIFFVKKFMDNVTYRYQNNRNHLILEKYYSH